MNLMIKVALNLLVLDLELRKPCAVLCVLLCEFLYFLFLLM